MDLTVIECTTSGLYAWGSGMQPVQAAAWDGFWRGYRGNFWNAVVDGQGSVFLSTTYGGGMIHPMDFQIGILQPPERMRNMLCELDEALRCLSRRASFMYTLGYRHYTTAYRQKLVPYSTEKGRENPT